MKIGKRMLYPVSELLDRYTITILKKKRIQDHDSLGDLGELKSSLLAYLDSENDSSNRRLIFKLFRELYEWNREIWDVEAAIRAGRTEQIDSVTGWELCLKVRDLNRSRNAIKNKLVELSGEGFREVRINCVANPNET